MIIEATKKTISVLEYILMLGLLTYYICCIYSTVIKSSILGVVSLYPLALSLYYYVNTITGKVPEESGNANGVCAPCKKFKSQASSHCEFCDVCVVDRDHHCALVGKCIHRKNSHSFLFFLFFLTVQMFINIFTSRFPDIFVLFTLFSSAYIVWICYVWSQEKTSIGFFNGTGKPCSLRSLYKLIFDENASNVKTMFLPFLRLNAKKGTV